MLEGTDTTLFSQIHSSNEKYMAQSHLAQMIALLGSPPNELVARELEMRKWNFAPPAVFTQLSLPVIFKQSSHSIGSGPGMALSERPTSGVYRNHSDTTPKKSPGKIGMTGHGATTCLRGRSSIGLSLTIRWTFIGYEAYVNRIVAL